jgi:hypothetical protein
LGFLPNQSRNCCDLSYTRTDNRIVPLHFSGAKPHLLIRYQAAFMGNTEIQVIVPGSAESSPVSIRRPSPGSTANNTAGENAATAREASTATEENITTAWEASTTAEGSRYSGESRPAGSSPAGGADIAALDPDAERGREEERLRALLELAAAGEETGGPSREGSRTPADENHTDGYDPGAPLFAAGNGAWIVQVGAFAEDENAEQAYTTLINAGFTPERDSFQGLTRIFVRGIEETAIADIAFIVELLGFGEPYIRK